MDNSTTQAPTRRVVALADPHVIEFRQCLPGAGQRSRLRGAKGVDSMPACCQLGNPDRKRPWRD